MRVGVVYTAELMLHGIWFPDAQEMFAQGLRANLV